VVVRNEAGLRERVRDGSPARVFAEDDLTGAPEELGRERLVRVTILEQASDVNAGFVRESAAADDGLAVGDGPARGARDELGQFAKAPRVDGRTNTFDLTECSHDFLERRVARTFTEAEHAHADVRGAAPHRRQRVRGGHAEVVVTMKLELEDQAMP
jgi:hypothetical protein